MKKLIAAALISSFAFSANAGSITYEAPQNVSIEVEPNMRIGGSWIIPAIILSVVALALINSPDEYNEG